MKPGIPWSVKGIEPEVREAAKHAARRAGMTLGEWLNSVILDQNEQASPEQQGEQPVPPEPAKQIIEQPAARRAPPPVAAAPSSSRAEAPRPAAPSPRSESALRLEDIAHQLAQLAQRERESAAIQAYQPPAPPAVDQEALDRILDRIESNERQAVEAFTAVNERLSVLGRQISMVSRPAQTFEKPEDVPGFTALEGAIRNVVEHLEVSEKRTRDSLKTMQDRLADMAEKANRPTNPDELLRSASVFAGLEARIADMTNRLQRSENLLHAGLPELVRNEINQLTDRIESVRAAAESMSQEARESAAGAVQGQFRDIEARILGVLKEAKVTINGQRTAMADLSRLKDEFGGVTKRLDDLQSQSASERDVHALRVAVEQLSTRVAQGPDMRPIADMDRRLGELNRKLDLNAAATRNMPQFGELEKRIAELDHRLGEAMRLQGSHEAVEALEEHLAAVNERVGRTEEQLGHLETMERAIRQLYDSLEQNRVAASQTAEDAANRAVERFMAAQTQAGPSPELRAMEEGLRAVRESATHAEQRNQETLEAVHETLEQIVNKLAELETASAGHQLAANMAQQAMHAPAEQQSPGAQHAAPETESPFFDPAGNFEQQLFAPAEPAAPAQEDPAPDFSTSQQAAFQPEPQQSAPSASPGAGALGDLVSGDDFIAAARRAAQAAASKPSVLKADPKPEAAAPAAKKGFAFPFLSRSKALPEPVTFVDGKPVVETKKAAAVNESKRKKLVLAGIVLLAAVSAFAFNMMAKPKAVKQTSAIEAPVTSVPAATPAAAPAKVSAMTPAAQFDKQDSIGLVDAPSSDPLATGSLPARKTDATLSSIVGEPTPARAEVPPPEAGPQDLRDAAARGDANAQFIIASRYLDGQGIAQDLTKAAYWYQQSASRGLAPAQYRLGTLFERGKGVPQDAATALLWYERAAEGGNVKAMHNAAVIAAGSLAGTPNYDKAFKWFKQAAEHGLQDSQFNLAVLYERGLGTRVDQGEAMFWYMLAGKQGDADAVKRAAALAKAMGEPAAAITARAENWKPMPTEDAGNVVAVADPDWNDPAAVPPQSASVLTPEPAAQMSETMSEADSIAEAQALLTRLGYNVGTPDGRMGSRTANAIRLFQLQSGLKVTGEVTPEVLEAMRNKAS